VSLDSFEPGKNTDLVRRRPGSSVRVLALLILPALLALAASGGQRPGRGVARATTDYTMISLVSRGSGGAPGASVMDRANAGHAGSRPDSWMVDGTPTPVPTRTGTASPTVTPSPTATATVTPSPTPTATSTPLPTSDGVVRTLRVPILMYHHVSSVPPNADVYRRDLSVSPEQFDQQLRYLRAHGYHSVSLRDLLYALNRGWPLPPNPIVLTFDDGYADAYNNAFPLLRKYGFTATFFVLTAFADENRPGYLTWTQIARMSRAGMEIGSHSKDHPDLRRRGRDFLVWQILGSKQSIEAHTSQMVYAFSYPSGQYDAGVEEILKEAGFLVAVTTAQGTVQRSDRLLRLSRVRVRGSYTVHKLAEMIDYWMAK